ncbi:peptidoglycan DD-metalloendopeptidase family protein [Orrella sp. 11846]|uniref:peptidoglycan DD-metalloendopeptidase family protein n=1 Tax=Orrella sp. 11846 TaxID=3409913 RepID=UPI003B5BEB65
MKEIRALTEHFVDQTVTQRRPLARWYAVAGAAVLIALAGCSGTGMSPVTDLGAESYTVRSGDTLSSISRRTGVSVAELQRLNGISNPSMIRPGQRLRLGSGAQLASGGSQKPLEPAKTIPSVDKAKLNMMWPTKGKVTQRYSKESQGIDIVGEVGQPVHAATAGKVAYAGNGVRGLGNLIILEHSDGYMTVYAHNEKLLVKVGDNVARGSQIATLGQTETTSPRLHFEVRRKSGEILDPMAYLPDNN